MSYETIEYRGCRIRVEHDTDAESPREWCNVGTMACWHRRYTLGDEQPSETNQEYLDNLANAVVSSKYPDHLLTANRDKILAKHYVILPLYLYDHSGITMSTGRFSCPWDSGQVGIIYCTMDRARKEWGEKYNPGITDAEIRAKAEACLKGEVETYDSFLTGDVFGYVAETEDGDDIGSVWGFFPDTGVEYSKRNDYMIGEAKAAIDSYLEKKEDEAKAAAEAEQQEQSEKQYWAERDVATV